MAANTAKITVQFFGRDKTLGKSFREQMKAAGSLDKKLKLLGARMQTTGRMMTMGVTLPIVAWFAAATKAAMDDERSQRTLAKQIRNTTAATDAEIASVEEFINVQARATGVADDELRPAFAKLVSATGSVTKSQKLLAIAQDTAAGTGRGLDSVITAMIKGQQGQVDLFGRMGIATRDAAGESLSFDEVLLGLQEKFDGLAEVNADPIEKMRVAFGELGESLGTFLVPILETLTSKLTGIFTWLENLSPGWRKFIVYGGLAVAALGPLLVVLGHILTILPALGAAFTVMTGPIGIVIGVIAGLIAVFVTLYKKNETFRNFVNKWWPVIKRVISEAAKQAAHVIAGIWGALKTTWEWIKKVKDRLAETWVFRGLEALLGMVSRVVSALSRAWDYLQRLSGHEGNFSKGGGGGTGGTGGGSFASGGIATGPLSGYPATLHGTELVVPLNGEAFAPKAYAAPTVVNVYLDSEPVAARVEVRQAKRARVNARTKGLALA
jgi:hypothetical protein